MALAIDSVGDAYVAGWTESANFPVTQSAYQQQLNGRDDVFVTKFPLGGSGTLSITGILPNAAATLAASLRKIIGTGFHAGATAKLNCGGNQCLGAERDVNGGGQILDATFDLTTTAPGSLRCRGHKSRSEFDNVPKGFTVQQGGAADFRVRKVRNGAIGSRASHHDVRHHRSQSWAIRFS